MPDAPRKVREWTRRYLPAELLGTATALLVGLAAHRATGEVAAAAAAGAVAENVGYYGWFAVRETRRHLAARPGRRARAAGRAARDLLVEFGPAEALDSLLARPALMYAGGHLVAPVAAGLLAGKLAADLVFYGCAAAGYELRRRHLDAAPGPPAPERTTGGPLP
ncbi:hypothetical protein GCM10010124_15120 [Pilimelia terevasa]|uniref:Uncharacterized protein n=1 Tax=Pilimelia terevasa TaxID=53372 RepID=A0A8J3BN79_9ACTN|nr:hypothetical protein [Pilimelia terevasa]GGK23647.1 hypothetical protein GCM10010124_15120 [Pilimelia terevasa]